MKLLKCIKNRPFLYNFTKNKLYEKIGEDNDFYILLDNNNEKIYMFKYIFTDETRKLKIKKLL